MSNSSFLFQQDMCQHGKENCMSHYLCVCVCVCVMSSLQDVFFNTRRVIGRIRTTVSPFEGRSMCSVWSTEEYFSGLKLFDTVRDDVIFPVMSCKPSDCTRWRSAWRVKGVREGRTHTNTHMKTFLSKRDMGSVVMSYPLVIPICSSRAAETQGSYNLYNRPPLSNNTCQDPTPPIRQAEGGNRGLSLGPISCTVLCPQPSLLIMLRDRQKETETDWMRQKQGPLWGLCEGRPSPYQMRALPFSLIKNAVSCNDRQGWSSGPKNRPVTSDSKPTVTV